MKRILVVDDYQPFLDHVRESATNDTTTVEIADSSRDALRRLREMPFDLVITDLFMESQDALDGFSVVKAAKACGNTEVIVVTGHGRPELCLESLRLGVFDYLERGTPGTHFRAMLERKIHLALDYRSTKLAASQQPKE